MRVKAKLEDIQTLSENKFTARNIIFTRQRQDGQWERQQRQIFDHGNAVTAFLYNKEKRTILLVKQFRVVLFLDNDPDALLLETCAGLTDGQAPKDAMVREIEEETGYQITDLKQVYAAYSSAGSLTEKLFYFIGEYKASQKRAAGGGLQDEQEELEVIEMPFEEAVDMLHAGKIQDVKTIVLLQYALLHKLLD